MKKIELESANNADKIEIDAYGKETDRMKVDGLPKSPESILTRGGEIETDEVQAVENLVGELHDGEVHRGFGRASYSPGGDMNGMG